MKTKITYNTNENGRRLVKGPRQSVRSQAASGEKYATGTQRRLKSTGLYKKKKAASPPKQTEFNILQLNISGIKNKKIELASMMSSNNIHIALIQESFHRNTNSHLTGYTAYPCTCENCRGIITYIRNDLIADCQHLSQTDNTDIQKTSVWFYGQKYTIYNVYSPPSSICQINDLQETMYTNTILAGDFNGHSPQWGYSDTNGTGKFLEELHGSTNLVITQSPTSTPTLLHRAHNTLSRPDLTIVSSDLDPHCKVQVMPDIGSDHRPIHTTVCTRQERAARQNRARWNFQKANWTDFISTTEDLFSKIDLNHMENVDTMEQKFSSIILEASNRHIPRGNRKKYKPFWNDDIQKVVAERQQARKLVEKEPTGSNKTAYNRASAKAKLVISTAKRAKWQQTCTTLDLRKDGRRAWTLLENISGTKQKTNTKAMPGCKTDEHQSEKLNKHFANINKSRTDKQNDKNLLKDLKERERREENVASIFTEKLKLEELMVALKTLKQRKTPGPDKIHNEMLQHLGPIGKRTLLHLLNYSWTSGQLPRAWKNAHIIPILKKDKDPTDLKSYRPISLTSCVGKVGEKIINRRLYWWLEDSKILTEDQAGFRAKSRTEDHLFRLCQSIQDGYQDGYHTTAVFIDLQQAYDRVWRKGLLYKMQKLQIQGNMYRWIKGFLSERTIQTKQNNALSSKQALEDGLPQGSALSCTLFLIFINDIVKNIKSQKALYADDLVIWHTGKYPRQSARHLNLDLKTLHEYCRQWKLTINPTKSEYSIFTLSPKEAKRNLLVQLEKQQLNKNEQPTYLGVQLDNRLTMNKHVANMKQKATKRLSLLKRLASTNWGSDMNTLRTLYIGYIRSVLDYNQSLIISSSQSTSSVLDRIQNHALRFICGGLRTTPTSACEVQANVEPLSLRRAKATLELTERCLRMPENNATRMLVSKWNRKSRLKHQSILHHAQELREKCHLPENRSQTGRVIKTPPHKQLICPDVKLKLLDENVSKQTDPIELKKAAENTIASYPDDWIHIYTDGSAFKARVNAGYGALICYPDGSSKELYAACGATCSNYEAELKGIQAALEFLKSKFQTSSSVVTNTVLYCDSKAALQSVESTNNCTEATKILIEVKDILEKHPIKLVFQWIPSHTNLLGNEKADRLAKKGAMQEQPQCEVPQTTAKMIIKQNFKEEWMNQWAKGTTGRIVYKQQNTVKTNDPIHLLQRKEQCAIFRLRTQHVPLNKHLNRINPEHTPLCPLCDGHLETVEHTLFQCPGLVESRQQLLPSRPDLCNTLYTTTEQLKKTAQFYFIAQGKRAEAHKPLD